MRRPKSKPLAIATSTVVVVAGTGIAYAFWTGGGSGSGSAATGTSVALTVNQTSTVTAMGPGDVAQPLSGNFDNPNSGPTYVGTVTASITSVTKAGGAPAGSCDATDYTLANAVMTVNAQIAAGNAQGSWSGASIKFNNSASVNQDGCQGATVNLGYTIG